MKGPGGGSIKTQEGVLKKQTGIVYKTQDGVLLKTLA